MSAEAKYRCVIISDIHFTPSTLELATFSLKAAINKATELQIPLVISGDTLDSKAIIRGECANRLIELLRNCPIQVFILVGNHDLLNEKGKAHSLNFLAPYCIIVDTPQYNSILDLWFIPYQNDAEQLKKILSEIPPGSTIIAHQGVESAYLGHYVQDKTSLSKESFADFRVISGHYHRAQDIKCGRPRKGAVGLFSYVGNPYSLSFSEAEDEEKGFALLTDTGILERVPTNLRRHVVLDLHVSYVVDPWPKTDFNKDDIVWIKVRGSSSELDKLNKKEIGENLLGHSNFKLDKICTDPEVVAKTEKMTEPEIMDALIDASTESKDQKSYLKKLWKELV